MKRLMFAAALVAGSAAMAAEGDPRVVAVGAVAPDILGIEIHAREVVHGRLQDYVRQDGDVIREEPQTTWLLRGGQIVGAIAGPEKKVFWNFDSVVGKDIDTQAAGRSESYSIAGGDAGQAAVRPTAVYRKSKPTDMARTGPWAFDFGLSHKLYLRLPEPLKPGQKYTVDMRALGLEAIEYVHDVAKVRSEAVHVNHAGFHPQDPAKRAYLSCWMGDGGGLSFPEGTRFTVIDAETGAEAFAGQIRLGVSADVAEDNYKTNHNGTNVYWMDFDALKRPGEYKVVVEGVGASYPFKIDEKVYAESFYVSARGFYHQRSGIELNKPYTTYYRPRPFHPDDGMKIYESTCSLLDSGNGLNREDSNFGNLVKGGTDRIVENAWGGYFDAGDWDRRIQHLDGARYLLELAELFPDRFKDGELNIPESGNGVPDIIDEALWGLDVYRRMQTADGGIRGGIESAEHPSAGETSWLESKRVYAYAPDEWSSYTYAGDAARAAIVVKQYDQKLADAYAQSAVRAFAFAESRTQKGERYAHHLVRDRRNHAALELWRLTGDGAYHEVFLATTLFTDPGAAPWIWSKQDQRDAAFLYARLDLPGQDAKVKANARAATLREATRQPVESTGFNWTMLERWTPLVGGAMSTPKAQLARAHFLGRDETLLKELVLNCQSGLGANPVNISYTIGIGHDWPRNALICDSRIGGLPPFPGVTVYGPGNPKSLKDNFGQKLVAPVTYPAVETWPSADAYFDVFLHPTVTEFTVMQNIAPQSYVLGYLSAIRP